MVKSPVVNLPLAPTTGLSFPHMIFSRTCAKITLRGLKGFHAAPVRSKTDLRVFSHNFDHTDFNGRRTKLFYRFKVAKRTKILDDEFKVVSMDCQENFFSLELSHASETILTAGGKTIRIF